MQKIEDLLYPNVPFYLLFLGYVFLTSSEQLCSFSP